MRDKSAGEDTVTEPSEQDLSASHRRRAPPEEGLLCSGQKLGRYVILDVVGSGGMGLVYGAYDPDLDRRVAIKVLRHTVLGDSEVDHGSGPIRLRREAQALAQLSHPNVLPIFDVGMVEGRVFIATEFVQGQTLAMWLREQKRDWRTIVKVFLAAGAGLEAAHRAGLVHRDFKPHNVLVSDEGAVRVMDFGLARRVRRTRASSRPRPVANEASASSHDTLELRPLPASRSPSPTSEPVVDRKSPSDSPSGSALQQDLTEAGTVLGTLPYLSPELAEGEPASAASDQYAFCVSLYEGLYGRRPFEGQGAELARAKATEDYAPRPADSVEVVPDWLDAIVVRGLRADPTMRWPSMAALRAELASHPSRAAGARRREDSDPRTAQLIDSAMPIMRRLAAQSEQSCHLVIQKDRDAVVVAQCDAPRSVGVIVQPGRTLSLHESVSGRLLAAFGPQTLQAAWLRSMRTTLSSERYTRLESTLARIRSRGHHVSPSGVIQGVTDMCVPVLDLDGAALAGLAIPCLPAEPSPEVRTQTTARILKLMQVAARDISEAVCHAATPGRG